MPPDNSSRARTLHKYHPHLSSPAVISAPIRPYALSPLANAVSLAGGLGFISSTPAGDARHLAAARKALLPSSSAITPPLSISDSSQRPAHPSPTELDAILHDLQEIQVPAATVPVGIGYQIYQESLAEKLRDVRTYLPCAVWLFAWASTEMVCLWARAVHAATAGRAKVWIQVGAVQSALAIVGGCVQNHSTSPSTSRDEALPCMPLSSLVLVAQGTDAGGHQLQRGASLITLLPEMLDALADAGYGEIPVLGAGGVIDARGAAAALALGAAGVVLGTRLMGARELDLPDGFREHVLQKRDGGVGTVTTRLYDRLRGTGTFPEGWYGRAAINKSWRDVEAGVDEAVVQKEYERMAKREAQGEVTVDAEMYGDDGRLTEYVGTGAGLLKEVKGAADIVKEIRDGINAVLNMTTDRLKL